MSTAVSFFANVELVPGDPILGLTEAYNADSRPTKVNLGAVSYTHLTLPTIYSV